MKPHIEVIIDNDGNVTMEGIGFKGKACDAAMQALEKSIGKQTARINKPEYHTMTTTSAIQKVGGK